MRNRIITLVLNMKTPTEMLLGEAPDNSRMKISGCAVYAFKYKEVRNGKLSRRAEAGVSLGSPDGAFRLYNPSSGEMIHTIYVTFDEGKFSSSRNRQAEFVYLEGEDDECSEQSISEKGRPCEPSLPHLLNKNIAQSDKVEDKQEQLDEFVQTNESNEEAAETMVKNDVKKAPTADS